MATTKRAPQYSSNPEKVLGSFVSSRKGSKRGSSCCRLSTPYIQPPFSSPPDGRLLSLLGLHQAGPNEEIHFRYDVTKGPARIVSATSATSQVHSSNENSRPTLVCTREKTYGSSTNPPVSSIREFISGIPLENNVIF